MKVLSALVLAVLSSSALAADGSLTAVDAQPLVVGQGLKTAADPQRNAIERGLAFLEADGPLSAIEVQPGGVGRGFKIPPDPQRIAIERGLTYLEKEGVRWREEKKCASCHHVPMTIWTMNAAKARGFAVNEKTLADLTAWAFAENNEAKILPGPNAPPEQDVLSPAAVYLSLATEGTADAGLKPARERFARHMAKKQNDDGSWTATDARSPISEGPESATLLTAMALAPPGSAAGDPANPVSASLMKAEAWIEGEAPGDTNQARSLRLLFAARSGKPAAETRPVIEAILKSQSADGGWGQTKEMPSDALATGQTLYALTRAGVKPLPPPPKAFGCSLMIMPPPSGSTDFADGMALARAVSFLAKTQKEDGSWPMTSRPIAPGGAGAKDLWPISYAGTAWAILGLLGASPSPGFLH